MRALLVVISLLAPPVIAADFRGTDFGSPCAAIDEREIAAGSNHGPWIQRGPGAYPFMGRAFERDVRITYLCRDGVLKLGDYHFPPRRYDDAVSDFAAAYSFYSSAFGSPLMVYSKPGVSPVLPAVGTAAPADYHVTWRAEGYWIHLDIMLHGDAAGTNWQVMAIVSEDTK
jgi:hypothetical protein